MTASPHASVVLLAADLDGEAAHVLTPSIPDNAPAAVREGLARRAIVNTGGTCPCGARLQLPNRAARRHAARRREVLPLQVRHDDACPATNANLDATGSSR